MKYYNFTIPSLFSSHTWIPLKHLEHFNTILVFVHFFKLDTFPKIQLSERYFHFHEVCLDVPVHGYTLLYTYLSPQSQIMDRTILYIQQTSYFHPQVSHTKTNEHILFSLCFPLSSNATPLFRENLHFSIHQFELFILRSTHTIHKKILQEINYEDLS